MDLPTKHINFFAKCKQNDIVLVARPSPPALLLLLLLLVAEDAVDSDMLAILSVHDK